MSKAYKCDRCGELFTGRSARLNHELKVPWDPDKHAHRTGVELKVKDFTPEFGNSTEVIIVPDLCGPCLVKVVELAVEKVQP